MINVEAIEAFLRKHKHSKPYKRGQVIFTDEPIEIVFIDHEKAQAECKVPSQSAPNHYYTVRLFFLDEAEDFSITCDCPYKASEYCKHSFAALMEISDYVTNSSGKEFPDKKGYLASGQFKQMINSRQVKTHKVRENLKNNTINNPKPKPVYTLQATFAQALPAKHLADHTDFKRETPWSAELLIDRIIHFEQKEHEYYGKIKDYYKTYTTTIKMDPQHNLICSCNCGPRSDVLCSHAYALLMYHASKKGLLGDVLFPIRDNTAIIEEKLKEYGYTLDDPWKEDFELKVRKNGIELIPTKKGISKIGEFADWQQEVKTFFTPQLTIPSQTLKLAPSSENLGILWSVRSTTHSMISLYLLSGKRKKGGDLGAPLRVIEDLERFQPKLDKKYRFIFDSMQDLHPNEYLFKHNIIHDADPPSTLLHACQDEFYYDFLSFIDELWDEEHYFLSGSGGKGNILTKHIQRIYPQQESPKISFQFQKGDTHFSLTPIIDINQRSYSLKDFSIIAFGILQIAEFVYILSPKDARTLSFFEDKEAYLIRHEDVTAFTRTFLMPLAEQYTLEVKGDHIPIEIIEASVKKIVYLKEIEDHLLFIPAFQYHISGKKDFYKETKLDGGKNLFISDDNTEKNFIAQRDVELEEETKKWFQQLHPSFEDNRKHYFAIPLNEVMKKHWFFSVFEQLREKEFTIFGLKELQKIKYNPYRPQVSIRAGSGTDWFDLNIEISFGDQRVNLNEIKKALMKQQEYVKLGDGSMGILPKEWLEKYSSIFKLGKIKKNQITLSQFQIGLIDELYEEIDNNEVLYNLIEKQVRLKSFESIVHVAPPEGLRAELRNYQKEGFNWLNFLDEFGWGGCLADDMGLGKTIQVLALLMKVSRESKGATHLIVVPSSLVFNWIEEIDKFCPTYTYLNYTGSNREKNTALFEDYHLVITTYGLVRSDIKLLKEYPFHYIVLDESQAIKNPTTKIAKAVKLLTAKNRIVMTGTPVENSTFDLFSQMDFLNPGMLGSLEAFRDQFAHPIDRDNDEAASVQLRKLVYPFILSRKKGQVAKELPEKTEITLYCEMKNAQRKVYEYYKQKYRQLLTEKFDEEGFSKSGVYILQGLNKLRQVCNSPALVSDPEGREVGFTDQSAKLDMLMDHLEEIFSEGHKALVFSFFTGMLDIIESALIERKVDSVKLTGQSRNRKALVETFKSDSSKNAFLISLKAGGFGLNLTEASYVFLVDPWWNPAVEQQAIDRTHRIGQTQQVFAYKLICKSTIEEKILKLQQKKKVLADDIVHTETGLLKTLTQEDIQELFS